MADTTAVVRKAAHTCFALVWMVGVGKSPDGDDWLKGMKETHNYMHLRENTYKPIAITLKKRRMSLSTGTRPMRGEAP